MSEPQPPLRNRIETDLFLIGCSRCANEALSEGPTLGMAEADFLRNGWAIEDFRVYCPACMGDLA